MHPYDRDKLYDIARQIAATECGCPCSGGDPPEPDGSHWEAARKILYKEGRERKED
jgi:hypothetical protein